MHALVLGVARRDVEDLVALELGRGLLDRPLRRLLLEVLGARGALLDLALLVVHLRVALDELRLALLELQVHDVEEQLDLQVFLLLALAVDFGLVEVGHEALAG